MKLSDKQLRRILREVMEGCGCAGCEDQGDHDSLHSAVDSLMKDNDPMIAGHGGKARMARGHLYHIAKRAQSLHDRFDDDDELPEWVQSKLAVAEAMVNSVYDHMDYKLHKHETGSLSELRTIVREAAMPDYEDDFMGPPLPDELPTEVDADEDGTPDHDPASGTSSGTHSTHTLPDVVPPDATVPAPEDDLWSRLKDRFTPSEETVGNLKRAGKGLALVGGAAGAAAAARHAQASQRKKARKEYNK